MNKSRSKEIHFYTHGVEVADPPPAGFPVALSWGNTKRAILSHQRRIDTFQMGCLSLYDRLFESKYRIFIHDLAGTYEIRLGDCDRTTREIRRGHNIFKMWVSGEFDV